MSESDVYRGLKTVLALKRLTHHSHLPRCVTSFIDQGGDVRGGGGLCPRGHLFGGNCPGGIYPGDIYDYFKLINPLWFP